VNIRDRRIVIVAALVFVSGLAWWYMGAGGPEEGVTVGERAQDFTVVDLRGESFVLSEHRGELVIIDFMTTWCGPCELELRELEELYDSGDGFTVVSVEIDQTLHEEDFEAWVTDKGFKWFVGQSPETGRQYKVNSLPTIVVVDKEGEIVFRANFTTFEQLKLLVEEHG